MLFTFSLCFYFSQAVQHFKFQGHLLVPALIAGFIEITLFLAGCYFNMHCTQPNIKETCVLNGIWIWLLFLKQKCTLPIIRLSVSILWLFVLVLYSKRWKLFWRVFSAQAGLHVLGGKVPSVTLRYLFVGRLRGEGLELPRVSMMVKVGYSDHFLYCLVHNCSPLAFAGLVGQWLGQCTESSWAGRHPGH